MKPFVLLTTLTAMLLLAGCNWNNAERDTDNAVRDVENGVRDAADDTRDVIDETLDTVDPNNPNGHINEGTMDRNGAYPNGSSNPNGENGVTAPGAPSVNQEDIIEDNKDRKDKDKIDQ